MPLFLLTWPAEHQAFCRTLRLRSLLCFQGFMTPAFNDYFESLSFSLWCVWKKLNEKPAAQSCFDLRLFDLVFKALPSTDHLQLVTLLLLIIILSPSGFLLCPKHCVLFRTNNVTWQRAAAPTLFSSGCQHRAEAHTCAGGDHVDKWADVSCPGRTTSPVCELMSQHKSQTQCLGATNTWIFPAQKCVYTRERHCVARLQDTRGPCHHGCWADLRGHHSSAGHQTALLSTSQSWTRLLFKTSVLYLSIDGWRDSETPESRRMGTGEMVIHSLEAFWRFLKRGYMSYCSPPSMSITCVLWRGMGGKGHVPRLNVSLMDVSDRSLSDRWKIYQTRLNLKVQVQNLAWEAGYTVRNTISNFSCSCTLCLIIHHYKRQDSR